MASLKNTKIGTRLAVAFALLLLLLAGVSALALNSMGAINASLESIVDKNNAEVAAANEMLDNVRDISASSAVMALLDDSGAMDDEMKKVQEARRRYGDARNRLARLVDTPEGRANLARVDTLIAEAVPANNRLFELARQNRRAEATQVLMAQARPMTLKLIAEIDRMAALQSKLSIEAAAAARDGYERAAFWMLLLGAAALLIGVGTAWSITRSITRPIREALAIAERVAGGDLTSTVEVRSTDEAGRLMSALQTMNLNLARIVGEVRQGTGTIAAASGQIATGNQDLSSRTEEQASSLEQTAASMEELTSTVRQNAENARQANVLATAASQVAVRGGDVVHQVVGTMSAIHASSRKIVDIIAVIEGIAFQTNILALNAAVEAARAGEQGRGFAVVASEVRSLAQRSGAAAKEIKTLIDDSVQKVEQGSRQVADAGQTMSEIVGSVRRVTDIMGEITAASQEQTSGIEQINQAITQMDHVTQQNAALVEQAAAAANSLQEQAGSLVRTVGVFNTGA